MNARGDGIDRSGRFRAAALRRFAGRRGDLERAGLHQRLGALGDIWDDDNEEQERA